MWHERLFHFQVKTPSPEFDTMINTWNAYNCFMTFIWSRAASFVYCGLRNGYGYRDIVQDIQGVIHLAPSVPEKWNKFEIEKDFRGKHLHIVVKNPNNAQSGYKKMTVNGQKVEDNYIPESILKEQNEEELIMS